MSNDARVRQALDWISNTNKIHNGYGISKKKKSGKINASKVNEKRGERKITQ